MTLSIQSIRSFLANQTSSPLFQNGGNTAPLSSANKVQDSYSFSVSGISRSAESQGMNSLELMRARLTASQDTLPARQDSAVLEANRTNFNLFRDAIERLKDAEKQSQSAPRETPPLLQVENNTEGSKLVEKIAGVAIPATAKRQLDPLTILDNAFGDVTASNIAATFGVQPPPQPVSRPQTAEEIAAPVYTPLAPPQPDTNVTTGFRDREQGGFITTPLSNRSQEDVSTVANGLVPPTQAAGLFPPITTPGIPAPTERRSLAIDGEEQNNPFLQPPGHNPDRAAFANRVPPITERSQNRPVPQPDQGNNQPAVAPTGAATDQNNLRQVAPANNPTGDTTLAGATANGSGLFSLRGTLVRNPTEQRLQAQNKETTNTPRTGLSPVNRNAAVAANTIDTSNVNTGRTPPPPPDTGFGLENQATPFAFFGGFQGRTGEPNPSTLPRAATLNFTNGANSQTFGLPPFGQETNNPTPDTSETNQINFQPIGSRANRANPNLQFPTPADNQPRQTTFNLAPPQTEQANPNPTIIPVNRTAALSYYARLGGFGREMDASQGPTMSLVA